MADAPAPTAATPAQPKRSLWLLITVVVAVALVTGAGVYLLLRGGETEEIAAEQPADKADKAGKSGKAGKAVPKQPAEYIRLDPPFVVNFEAKGMMRFLQVSVELMTRDLVTADMIKKHDPMIRNDLIMLLGNQQYTMISTREGKEQLRAEALQAVANVITAEGGDGKKVEQLYFTSFVMQ